MDTCCRRRVRNAIERYARDHPQASDTASGVTTWWVRDATAAESLVREILEELVEEGVLTRIHLPGGGELFRINANAHSLN